MRGGATDATTTAGREATEALAMRYFRSWQQGDFAALRECLADDVRLDWGVTTYTDPDEFVRAADAGITWDHVTLLGTSFSPAHALLLYEATNTRDRVRVKTAEHLTIEHGKITRATVRFATVALD